MSAEDEQTPAVRVTLRDIWTKQEEMSKTLQSVAQAVTPLVGQVGQLEALKLSVSDYHYERDMRDHQQGDFRTTTESRIRDLELWKASRTGISSFFEKAALACGGAGVAFALNHLVR